MAQQQRRVVRYPVLGIPLAVDIDRFEKARSLSSTDLKHQFGFDPDRALIGIAGRLKRWKGMQTFAEAMGKIIQARHDCQGVIVGGPHDLEYAVWLEQSVEQLGLTGKVRLVGKQNNIPTWMQAIDIFVHASEGKIFRIVVVETMSVGKPLVATEPSGPEEIILHGENGLLVSANDPHSLRDAILNYLSDTPFATRIGFGGKKTGSRAEP